MEENERQNVLILQLINERDVTGETEHVHVSTGKPPNNFQFLNSQESMYH